LDWINGFRQQSNNPGGSVKQGISWSDKRIAVFQIRHNTKELINVFHGVRMLRLGAVLTRNETPAFNDVMNPSQ
jgi:hypothetical protein